MRKRDGPCAKAIPPMKPLHGLQSAQIMTSCDHRRIRSCGLLLGAIDHCFHISNNHLDVLDAWILAELAGLHVGVVIVQGALSARHLRHLDPVVQRPLDCLLEDQAPGRNPNRRERLRRERVAGRFAFYTLSYTTKKVVKFVDRFCY